MRSILTGLIFLSALTVCAQDPLPKRTILTDSLRLRILDEVVVSATKKETRFLQSPVTVEKLNEKQLLGNGAPSFFDAIQTAKGVQMITPSLGFRVINTRGFTNTTNVRFAQLVDGMDVQSPHIGAPVGNALGPGDLDINSVEILPGSGSALYGMNAINGMANFFTKSPFTSQGLSIQQKTGVNHVNSATSGAKLFTETAIRYARAISPRFAFKINGTFSKGFDWMADDHKDLNAAANTSTGLTGSDNPGADPVNGYGNESSNRRTLSLGGKSYVVSRTGYYEKDVADYSISNIKADAVLQYKIKSNAMLSYVYRLAEFNVTYQRSNRFTLDDYTLQQHGLQYSSGSIKAKIYLNTENTGQSYNLRSMAENIDRSFKSDDKWFADYSSRFNREISSGYTVTDAHNLARQYADSGRLQPGSALFNETKKRLQGINNWDSGAALQVKARLLHAELQVDLTEKYLSALKRKTGLEILAGGDMRTYYIVPDGNYFINPAKGKSYENFSYYRWGGFASFGEKLFKGKLKPGIVIRIDQNEYFDVKANFRGSMVYSPDDKHNIRVSYQNGYRYPSIFEGFSNVNSGGVKRVGGLRVMSDGVFEKGWLKSSIDAFQAAVTKDINTLGLSKNAAIEKNKTLLKKSDYTYLKPEHLRSLEIGYKGLFFDKRLLVDASYYFNRYQSFIAQVETSIPNTEKPDSIPYALYDKKTQSRYRMWTNSKSIVNTYGAEIGIKYIIGANYTVDANTSYAKMKKKGSDDGLEDGFNTPQWMVNVSVANDKIIGNLGACLTYRWQDSYLWESFLINGYVPANSALDMQLTYLFPEAHFRIKAGATNLLNHYYNSFLGGPQIGGFYYTTLSWELK